ncbi:hypothetical protein tinsulaeT_36490 [Thalassotalea insulae]|uniref:ABC transport system substrate-binding protein n=1 Tax=Thalassotalea insulae TaxID=2056778 RepID=A0ABQ6GXA4_9GAMM|nr:ABC transporter substrate binding protein [Thalassotalea insulae]GLX80309.1 hypothetical protein tinsulaeT_36490 [Thalassotalea insulae]
MRNTTLLIVFIFLCFFNKAYSEQLTVVYPEVKAPYDAIFEQIIQGVSNEFGDDIIHLKLPNQFDVAQIAQQITTQKVIALGKRGLRVARKIYQEKQVVVGALPIRPSDISGVSLMTAPDLLFDALKELAPQVTTINVFYTAASTWIIDIAQQEAHSRGLTVNAQKVDDLRTAVTAYNKLFEQGELKNTAIWLPIDPITANEKIIVPVILEKAWENKMPVFSAKPSHAKRGALFSAIPNNEFLGGQLVRLLNTLSHSPNQSTVSPLKGVKLAVNLRTAAHLGYNYSATKRADFAITFPK